MTYDTADSGFVSGGPGQILSSVDPGDMWFRLVLTPTLISDIQTSLANGCDTEVKYRTHTEMGAAANDAESGWNMAVRTNFVDLGVGLVLMDQLLAVEDHTSAPNNIDTDYVVPLTSTEMSYATPGDRLRVRALGHAWADAVNLGGINYTSAYFDIEDTDPSFLVRLEYYTP